MASGYPGRDFYATLGGRSSPYQQIADGGGGPVGSGGGGILKRSLLELERQQQIQHAMFLRSVKQRTHHLSSPLSSVVEHSAVVAQASASPAASSCSSGFSNLLTSAADQIFTPPAAAAAPPEPDSDRKSTMRNCLQELERQLLNDDEDDGDEASASGSVVTETMQQLLSPAPPAVVLSSPSPTTSSSSTSSSTASCSPGSATPSRQLLLDTAAAVADGNTKTAATYLAVLNRAANPRGDPDQRLTAMMVSALLSRINHPPPAGCHPVAELCSAEHQAATQLLFDFSPCFKLGLLAANLAILDATLGAAKIHILDFGVGQGGQHFALIHALAERHRHSFGGRPPAIKITAVCDPTSITNCFSDGDCTDLRIVGDRLARMAERLGMGLRFSIVRRQPAELDETVLGCETGEALAVNLAFHLSRVADESVSPANPRDEILRRVRSLRPRVVALVEQEINCNTAPFAARFTEACGHYGALLESLDVTAARESSDRARVEACLARKAANSVAREGAERVERCEVFGKWRARMAMAGLRPTPLGPAVTDPVRARLGLLQSPRFTIRDEAGGLCFGWMGRTLTVASAWHAS